MPPSVCETGCRLLSPFSAVGKGREDVEMRGALVSIRLCDLRAALAASASASAALGLVKPGRCRFDLLVSTAESLVEVLVPSRGACLVFEATTGVGAGLRAAGTGAASCGDANGLDPRGAL